MAATALEKEAVQRLKDARACKSQIEVDLREGYFFTAPRRSKDVSSNVITNPDRAREDESSLLHTSLAMEVAQDFATEVLNTFMPEVINWCDQKPGIEMSEDEFNDIKDDIDEQTAKIMAAIKASNFYAAAAQAFMPDLSLGTVALWIDSLRPNEPIVCQHVPLRELEINVGPYGEVDDRFIVRSTRYRHIPALLPGVRLPDGIRRKVKDDPNRSCQVRWGFWRRWDDTSDVVWQWVIMIGDRVVDDGVLRGEGSCPLIVGRMNVDQSFPYGDGPTLQALPELRRLDELEKLDIEARDFQVHKPFFYADDGVINLSGGIEPGMGYPARPWGSGAPFLPMDFGSDAMTAEYTFQKIEARIRRLHFIDFPQQVGKTPPTAEQWLDELARAKRRIGTPGKVFWKEFPAQVFLRFKYLLEQRGAIAPVKVNGNEIALVPYDPTEQAQEHQDVQIAGRILEMARAYLPQTAEVIVDGPKTLENIKEKLRDSVVVLRSQEEIARAVQQLAPVLGGGGGMPAGTEVA